MWNHFSWNDYADPPSGGIGHRSDRAVHAEIVARLESIGVFDVVALETDGEPSLPARASAAAIVFPGRTGRIDREPSWERRLRTSTYEVEITAFALGTEDASGRADRLASIALNALSEDPGYLGWCLPDRTLVIQKGVDRSRHPDCTVVIAGQFSYVFKSSSMDESV